MLGGLAPIVVEQPDPVYQSLYRMLALDSGPMKN